MFLDIGFAIIIAKILAKYFALVLSWKIIILAILFVILPDSDIFYYAYQKYVRKKIINNHRSFLHYPAVYILPALLLYLASPFFGVLFALCIFFHFLHDTFFLGWGVVWLWPYKETRYKCFPDRNGKIMNIPLVSWEKSEEKALIKKHHNVHWVRDFYLRPSIVSVLEYSLFLLALFILCKNMI